jgi:O-antigen/teichoic acid export membrane protein
MIKSFISKLSSKEKIVVYKNIIFSGIGQAINYIIPLIVLPLFNKRLGLEKVGDYSIVAVGLFNYISLLVGFGFTLSTIRYITANQSEQALSKLFSEVFYSKIFNSIIAIIFCATATYFYHSLNQYFYTILLAFVIYSVGWILYQDWLIVGLQKAEYQFAGLFVSRTFYLFVIFCTDLVNDLEALILLEAVSNFLLGLVSFLLIKKQNTFQLNRINYAETLTRWKESFTVFSSYLFVYLYSSVNLLIMGYVLKAEMIGLYSFVDRMYLIFAGGFAIVLRALFPYLANIYNTNRLKFFIEFTKLLKLLFISLVIVMVIIYFNIDFIVKIVAKNTLDAQNFTTVSNLYKLMLPLVILSICSAFFSYFFFILKNEIVLLKILLSAAIFNLCLVIFFLKIFQIYGIMYIAILNYILIFSLQSLAFNKIRKKAKLEFAKTNK